MAIQNDRIGDLINGIAHKRKIIISPEGIPLNIRIANHWERLTAFAIDMIFITLAISSLLILTLFLIFAEARGSVTVTAFLFTAFIVRNMYFMHFELGWQGRTPGKIICGIRVINRSGGELSPSAIIARNLTREVEFFLPATTLLALNASTNAWQLAAGLGWILVITSIPLWNRDHLRAGDLIGGTQVIAVPKRVLLTDLTIEKTKNVTGKYTFTHDQLAIYGIFELQVLEECLRQPYTAGNDRLLSEISAKICTKIGWEGVIPPDEIRLFLNSFYTAERAYLERGQLFGHIKADKHSGNKKI